MIFSEQCNVCGSRDIAQRCAQTGCGRWFCHEHRELAAPENCWRAIVKK